MTLGDNFPDVKVKSCECISAIASVSSNVFGVGNVASSLVPSVLRNFTHQQKRVRLSSVRAVGKREIAYIKHSDVTIYWCFLLPGSFQGVLLHHCSSRELQQSLVYLAQRLFDQRPEVRLAVYSVASELLTRWPHRGENFPLLVPLVITGLEDESPDNVVQCDKMWRQVGNSWLEEEAIRDKRIKDLIDFPSPPPSHYPSEGEMLIIRAAAA